ncbi:MAG: hypothetical protein JNK72_08445 [Myxococcales bacterium]|nr:hypothetical protein [Myxococcales bacterium]
MHPAPSRGPDDPRFVRDLVPVQSIVTSAGQSDAGLFQLDLRSERLLPFEGAGAISRWRLEFDPETNAFDTRTVTDVVLHLNCTARDGGAVLAKAAKEATLQSLEAQPIKFHMLSMAQHAPEALHTLLSATGSTATLSPGALRPRLGFVPRHLQRTFGQLSVVFVMREPVPFEVNQLHLIIEATDLTMGHVLTLPNEATLSIAPHAAVTFTEAQVDADELYDEADWSLTVNRMGGGGTLATFFDRVADVLLIVQENLSVADD